MAAWFAGPAAQVCVGLHSPMPPKTDQAHQPGHCKQGEGEVEMVPLYLPPTSGAKIHLTTLTFLYALHLFPQGLLNQSDCRDVLSFPCLPKPTTPLAWGCAAFKRQHTAQIHNTVLLQSITTRKILEKDPACSSSALQEHKA